MLADFGSQSLTASGSSAAPGSNATIASLAAPRAGAFKITAHVCISGAAEVAGVNWRIKFNGATFGDFPSGGLGVAQTFTIERANLDGTNVVTVGSGGSAATALTVYAATIVATQIG